MASSLIAAEFNPLKPSIIIRLHFEVFSDIQSAQMSEIKNGRLGLYGKV